MQFFLRTWRWLIVAAAMAGASLAICAQESVPSNPLRRADESVSPLDDDRANDVESQEASATSRPASLPRALPRSGRSVLANRERKFSQHEVWGDEIVDPQVVAALAIEELPSPEATTGVAWDEPAPDASQPLRRLEAEPLAEPGAEVPRIGFSPHQEPVIEESWHIDPHPPPGTHYSPEGLAAWRRWQEPWLVHTDPNDPHRHIGLGEPLAGTSWRNRPWFAGAFFGGAFHGDLTDNVRQNNGSLMGLRLGWDLDHYYGIEGRYAFANPQIMDGTGNSLGDSHDYIMDVSALYYPFGDARWRPYFGLGLGMATYRFRDQANENIHDSAVSLPISVGVKYFYSPHFTLRLDAVDNVTFGSDNIDAMNNFFLLASVEYRFGGRRRSYFPWHGGTAR